MVPGVEFVGVVGGEEVAGAELEGVGAFEVAGWVVGAVRRSGGVERRWGRGLEGWGGVC